MYGPETTAFNFSVMTMVYEPLLGLDPTTLQYIPGLATHWQISPDKMEYRFRLNPNARFSDGSPVTADDVVASWTFLMDKGLQEHQLLQMLEKFTKPVAESKYIVRVRSTELTWQNFLNFSNSLYVMPAKVLKGLDGVRYLKEYNFKLMPGSGPYIIKDEDVQKGRSIAVRRRPEYWGEKARANVGVYNFDVISWPVVRDRQLQMEMLKKGDSDYYLVNVSREWIEEFNFDKVQRGLIQKRKVFTDEPQGIYGIVLNMRREPFNDVRVRKALSLLLNRDLLIQKLFFNEYVPMNSYFPGGVYENPGNPKNAYDPQQALKLLGDAGWNTRDAQGHLTKNGKPLTLEYIYSDKGAERWLTIYQDDLRKVGIQMNLRLISYDTLIQLTSEFRFDMGTMAWQASTFPNPEVLWRSDLADTKNSFNLSGFKNKRADEIFEVYSKEFDQQKRVALNKELDGILAAEYPYVLLWTSGFSRVAYLNKFGHPDYYFTRIRDYQDMATLWWIDPAKERDYQRALADPSVKLPIGPLEVRYWQEYTKRGGGAFVPPSH